MKKKIKILYFTTTSQLFGTEKMILELSKRIDKTKFEVMICTIKDDLKNQLLEQLRKEDIETSCLHMDKRWKFWKIFNFYQMIRKYNPDIIQSFLFFDNLLARIVGKMAGIPIIISGQRNVENERSFIRNLIDQTTLFLADFIISNTEKGKNLLLERNRFNPEKIKVIYNGIQIDKKQIFLDRETVLKKYNIPKNATIIGFIGRLEKQKGVQYLIEAIKLLNKKTEIFGIFIGDGRKREKLENQAKNRNIIFLGRKDNALQYMNVFDFFVLPSIWEGMSNAILEAIFCEIPVITTKVGGNTEIVDEGKTGFLVEPNNSKALAKKIEFAMTLSKKEIAHILKDAKEMVKKKFIINEMVNKFEIFYIESLKEKNKEK